MPGFLPAVVGNQAGLVNTLPKVLGSSTLSGLMMLSGSVHAHGIKHCSLWRDLWRTVLPGLLVQFVLAPFFDFCVASTIPTSGHVWFLYSVALAKFLVHFVGRCGGGSVVAATLFLSLCASPIWHAIVAVAPGLSGARYDGLTWSSGDWFVPLGVRNLSYPVFFAFGVVVCPTSALLALRQRCTSISSLCGSQAWLWLLNGCFWAYSMQRLRLGGTNLFASAGLATWFARLPQQLEMLLVSLVSPLALLMLVPDGRCSFLTAAGDSTLSVYLLHPFALKLMRPLVTSAINAQATQGGASPADQTFYLLVELLLVPLIMLGSLSWVGMLLYKAARQAARHWAGAAPCACVGAAVLAVIGATLPPSSHDRVSQGQGTAGPSATAITHVHGASFGGGKAGSSGPQGLKLTIQNERFMHTAWPTGNDVYVHGSARCQHAPRAPTPRSPHAPHPTVDCPSVTSSLTPSLTLSRSPWRTQLCQLHDITPLLGRGAAPNEWAIASVAVNNMSGLASAAGLGGHHGVHHVTPFFCTDEALSEPILQRSFTSRSPFRCDTMPFIPRCEKMLFTFAPGDRAVKMPQGVALALSGRYVLLQVHYTLRADALARMHLTSHPRTGAAGHGSPVVLPPVSTTLELVPLAGLTWPQAALPQLKLVHFFELGPRFPSMLRIPPQSPRTEVTSICAPSCVRAALEKSPERGRFLVYAIRHHMHRLGTSMTTELVHANGTARPLWSSTSWNPLEALPFHMFEPPVELSAGAALRTTCVYSSMGRTNTTSLGAGLNDEMCYSYMLTTAVAEFSSCWHIRAAATEHGVREGCYGMCKGLGQTASFRTGKPNLTHSSAERFEIAGDVGGCGPKSAADSRAQHRQKHPKARRRRLLERAAQALDASDRGSATSTPEALPATRRIEFALHSGWGNMNLELVNAIYVARLLGRQLVVPHVMKHLDVAAGPICDVRFSQPNQTSRAEHIVHKYAHYVQNGARPTLDAFLTLNAVAADEVSSAVVWTKLPSASSELELEAEHCCRAKLDDKGVLRYLKDAHWSTCDVRRCTLVTAMCFKLPNASAAAASLRAVQSKTIAFASLFHKLSETHRGNGGALTIHDAKNTDCEFLAYRPELTHQVEKLLARALNLSSDGTGADGSYDAVHLRLGEGFHAAEPTPCGPNCVTMWPVAMNLLKWLDSRNESRPIYIASDLPSEALSLAKLAFRRRRFFTSAHLQVASHSLLGYLEHEEERRSQFMAPLLLDILVMVGAYGFFGNAGFYSTFTKHVHETRVCNALKKTRSDPPGQDQLILATKHIHCRKNIVSDKGWCLTQVLGV